MTQQRQPVGQRPRITCYKCKRTGIILLFVPGRAAVCLPCLHEEADPSYEGIANWVADHKPLDKPPKPPAI